MAETDDTTTPFRRERPMTEALIAEDGWMSCAACTQAFGFKVVGAEEGSAVKCPNGRCKYWIRLAPQLRERVSRRL